ncbi:FAD-dependent monooxygenase [Gordonia sp. L191]|uniref:FAD-dependent monooxygenase n=1 Tax=Gordonia sp. L191 TaxID=2982699 RepID=UPI0024C0C23A|nr:FAD-dependent monooxygenase [Gordonia sp. L191]WHU46519.1 FAD-dependent monooxygenase [Gordonia sp. L191]
MSMSFQFSSASFRLPAGEVFLNAFHHGVAIDRGGLIRILRHRAEDAGVGMHIGVDADALALSSEYDVVVAADGVSSQTRERLGDELGATVSVGRGQFIWCGSDTELPGTTFMPVRTDDGVFVVHAYPYAEGKSTWVVETDDHALARAGLGADVYPRGESDEKSLAYLSHAFSDLLGGSPLLGNASRWAHFRTVRCQRWSHGNVVLLGDAVATAHPSLGSGTKLAMEGAIALSVAMEHSDGSPDAVAQELHSYEAGRRGAVDRLQWRAMQSKIWWESFPYRMDGSPERVAVSFMSRGGAVGLDDLRRTDPELVRGAAAAYADVVSDQVPPSVPDEWILGQAAVGNQSTRIVDDLADLDEIATLTVDFDDAWGERATELIEQLRGSASHASGVVVVTGDAGRPALVHRLAFGERVRLELGLPVAIVLDRNLLADGIDALVAGRVDMLHPIAPATELERVLAQ